MPKKFYCSRCGIELKHERKVVPGKRIILDLVDPHECEGFSVKSSDDKPTVEDILNSLPVSVPVNVHSKNDEDHRDDLIRDKRNDIKTSSAPENLLDSIMRSKP